MINGCNVKSTNDTIVSDNNDLVLEKLYLNNSDNYHDHDNDNNRYKWF